MILFWWYHPETTPPLQIQSLFLSRVRLKTSRVPLPFSSTLSIPHHHPLLHLNGVEFDGKTWLEIGTRTRHLRISSIILGGPGHYFGKFQTQFYAKKTIQLYSAWSHEHFAKVSKENNNFFMVNYGLKDIIFFLNHIETLYIGTCSCCTREGTSTQIVDQH